jgi:hypothetical protein
MAGQAKAGGLVCDSTADGQAALANRNTVSATNARGDFKQFILVVRESPLDNPKPQI